jgi:hypothetical protein
VRSAIGFLLVGAMACAATAAPRKKPAARTKPSPTRDRHASSRFSHPTDAGDTPAVHYGALDAGACLAELKHREIAFTSVDSARGVRIPVRLAGPLHGVTFRTDERDSVRATSPYEIADCRLVLAMDDFAAILAREGVVEVRHYSMYRPPSKSWPEGKEAGQHNGALALDAGRFTFADGTQLSVDRDFHGAIGDATCGDKAAPHPATAAALKLRAILCETSDAHLFNVMLTPNFNRPHHNHFHLEVMAHALWFLLH